MTSYSTVDCHALHHPRTAKALFSELVTHPMEIINVENPTEPDPNLVLMSCTFPHPTRATIFAHNCQIKDLVVKLIMETVVKRIWSPQPLSRHWLFWLLLSLTLVMLVMGEGKPCFVELPISLPSKQLNR